MSKKYVLVKSTKKVVCGVVLFRIKLLRNIGIHKKGSLGGWIQKEKNLSQTGDSMVFGNSKVFWEIKT